MLPLASEAPGGPDMLLTASADGTLAVWDPSRTPVRGADRELAPRHSFKAHDNGITVRGGAQQAQAQDQPQVGKHRQQQHEHGTPDGDALPEFELHGGVSGIRRRWARGAQWLPRARAG